MTIEEIDVAVVGAGPAGLSAAMEAARLGARVTLFDDNPRPGGQYFRQPPATLKPGGQNIKGKDEIKFEQLREVTNNPNVCYRPGATVWNIEDSLTLAIADGKLSGRVRATAIVLATGARDRPVAYPGWTLPGVITAGGLQNLIKGMRVAPPGPVVVAGNGPLLLAAAASLADAGVKIAAVVEAAHHFRHGLTEIFKLVCAPSILGLAARYMYALRRAGTPIIRGQAVIAARGDDALQAVDVAPIRGDGGIDLQKTNTIQARTLVTGYGLVPSTELAQLLGAAQQCLPLRGGSVLVRDHMMMSSIPGVFAVGDGAAIGGAALSLVEGRIGGIHAAIHAGKSMTTPVQAQLQRDFGNCRRLGHFRAGLERLFETPANWLDLLTPETIICRCEDVTLDELNSSRKSGAASPVQLKAATRIGMGRCQGRNCLSTLAEIIGEKTGLDPVKVQMPRSRPPVHPVLVGDLLHEDLPPPVLPDDPHLPRRR